MILGLASMLGISAGATAVSGFAWFTTQRTAAIEASAFKVGASEGSLEITRVDADKNCVSTVNNSKDAIVPTASKDLADVSSCDGQTFYKAVLGTDGKIGAVVTENNSTGLSKVNTNQMVYVSWKVKVSNTADGAKLNVYLSNQGSIFSANDGAANTTTMEFTANGTNKLFSWDGVAKAVGAVKVGSDTKTLDNHYSLKGDAETGYTGIEFMDSAIPADGQKISVAVTLDYSQYYRMVIIDEGTDSENPTNTIVYRYTNSKHLSYLKSDSDKSTVNGTGLLKVTAEKGANADTTDDKYTETENTMRNISSQADVASYESTTVAPGNQLLISNLTADDTTNSVVNSHVLKFVVWCEGTATPEAAATAGNSVKMNASLVGLTVTA